ncbi:MAG: SPOR domain-containing protein [Chakrabartia sp.]
MGDNEELSLGKDDRLPWLEPVDDPSEEENTGRSKVIGLAIALLVATGLGAGGIWYVRSQEKLPNGNGALIAAPSGPYKTRPTEAGGMTVPGQGDTTFAASQGAEADGKLDITEQPEAPVTEQRVTDARAEPPVAAGRNARAPVAVGGILAPPKPNVPAPRQVVPGRTEDPSKGLIQLGSYSSEAIARKAYADLSARFPFLAGMQRSIVQTDVGGTTYFRLRMTAGAQAAESCARLKAGGASCIVIK